MKGKKLGLWARWAGNNPGKVYLAAAFISLVMVWGIMGLKMEMTFYSIMPPNSPQVRDLKRITRDYPFASAMVILVDGRDLPAGEAKQAVKNAIDEMTQVFSSDEYQNAVSGVYGRVDSDFIKKHGLMLADAEDLQRMQDMYADPDLVPFLTNLNDDLEREYSGDGEAMEDDEMQLTAWLSGLEGILNGLSRAAEGNELDMVALNDTLDSYLVGESHYLSREENMGLLFINPNYTINDLEPLVRETGRIERAVKSIAGNRGLKAGLTGLIVVGRDEMITSEKGFAASMTIAMVLILILMIMVFRIKTTPLIIGTPLILGIVWSAGLTGLFLHRLNIMTAMYLVALVGLGVDYAIHLMSAYVQERDEGQDCLSALENSFNKSGRGIVTGGLTTAAAFFALLMAESAMVQELAVVAGMGILAELAAMLMLIPAILGGRQKWLDRLGKKDPMFKARAKIQSDFAKGLGASVTRRPGLWMLLLLAAGLLLGTQASKVELEDNLMNMEAKGLESVELQDIMTDEFGMAPDCLYYISDNPDELPAMIDALEDLDSVKSADGISLWQPTVTQRLDRLPYLQNIRRNLDAWTSTGEVDEYLLLEELYRLEANLVEMGDLAVLGGNDRLAFILNRITALDNSGNKVGSSVFDNLFALMESEDHDLLSLTEYQGYFGSLVKERIHTMATEDSIKTEDLPAMIRDTFLSRKDESTLLSISPRMNPWEGKNRNIFTAQVETVTSRATGMILAADQMTAIANTDGRKTVIAALIAVFIILLLDFRNLKLSLLTFLPLLLSFASLYGIMAIFNIKLDFINIIAIPLLVGIGIDDSVHINHRYLLEGKGRMHQTLAKTGSAVAMTTVTTMIGFASFIPSVMRAMRSTGIVLTLAMALAFIFSIMFHPALLVLVSEKWGWNLSPLRIKFLDKGE